MKRSKEKLNTELSRAKTVGEVKEKKNRANLSVSKATMLQMQNVKRPGSPKMAEEPSRKKRLAIGDITNAVQCQQKNVKKDLKVKPVKSKVKNKKNKKAVEKTNEIGKENKGFIVPTSVKSNCESTAQSKIDLIIEDDLTRIITDDLELSSPSSVNISSQESSETSENTNTEEERTEQPNADSNIAINSRPDDVRDVDTDADPCSVCEYAESVFKNMKDSEAHFKIRKYIDASSAITPHMRAVLIDWIVEIQENFELYHETLYLAVNIVDLYLQNNGCAKDQLQLVGATSLFISCKVEERYAPPLDDFIYICDDIYSGDMFKEMERNILKSLEFKLSIPSSYRFLRRYGRVASVTMEVLTLARYILESSLIEYEFVDCSPSHIAASALNLALKMKKAGEWDSTLKYYSGYDSDDLLGIMERLNNMLKAPPKANVMNVHKKYSHPIFYQVAKTEPLVTL